MATDSAIISVVMIMWGVNTATKNAESKAVLTEVNCRKTT